MATLPTPRSRRATLTTATLVGLALLALAAPAAARGLGTAASSGAAQPLGGLGNLVDGLTSGQGLVVGVVVVAAGLVVGALFLGGTKFVNKDNVLENDSRREIFTYIKENPGTHLRATAQALDLSTTNVLWHLRKLEDANLVSHKKFEGYKLLYPREGGVETRRVAIASAVLRNDNARDILTYILATPGAHQREIARALDVNHGTVRWHLRKLAEAGLLEKVEKAYTTQYFISDLGNRALAEDLGVVPETSEGGAPA